MLKTIIREPLVHCLVLGAVLFTAWSWVAPQESAASDEVIILDQARLDHLETLWKAQWKRDPSPEDMAAIVDRHLRQEVFYREALRMGLDHDDGIIRTRLAQKMEAVASDLSTLMQPPTEEQLRAFHAERSDLFTLPQAFALQQVLYLTSEQDDIAAALAALQAGGPIPPERLNKLSIPPELPLTPVQAVENAFGGNFAQSLSDLPVGDWSGPIRSGLGFHLVKITENQPSHLAPFEDIKDYVAHQYEYYTVLDAQERVFLALLDKYEVRIDAEGVPSDILQGYQQQ